jgi:outer membrane lipoprotein SlyB
MKHLMLSAAIIAAVAGPAAAATTASATTDLNVRSGPAVWNEVTGVIPSGASVDVEGCLGEVNWCKVSYEGNIGWAYGAYLSTTVDAETISLAPETRPQVVQIIEDNDNSAAAPVGGAAVAGTIAAAVAAGPVGIAAAAVAGAVAADAAQPDERVITYVRSNPTEPVYLDGEIVVGAGIPDGVELYPIPDSEYSYVLVNGVPVIVEPAARQVVTIVR